MHVSQQIFELVEKGMTQELIADKANIHQSKVSRLSTGKTKNPRWSDVQAIRDLYQFVITENNHWDFYILETEEA